MKSFARRAVSAVLGLVTVASMTALVAAAPAGASTTAAAASKPAWFSQGLRWPVVGPGARGERVVTIQYLLQQRGFHSVRADGAYGPVTTHAVKAFQRQHGLRASGVVSASTWNRLILTLHRGDRGSAVRGVQHSLKFAYGFRFVRVNGNYNHETWLAVRAFQRGSNLHVNGRVYKDTWKTMVVFEN
jgi:peptidoglycan hydrolase-like protein with peptidoglycan-binding domain